MSTPTTKGSISTTVLLTTTRKITTTLKPSRIADIPMTFQLWFTLAVIVVVLTVLALNKGAPQHVMLAAVLILWNVELVKYDGKQILNVSQALAGFSNTSMITVGGLFVAIAAMERSRVINWLANRVLGENSTPYWASAKLQMLAFVLSAFTNNIPLTALLLPIICDWCRNRGFPSSKFLLPMNYANIAGGLLATIGTSTNLVVNGLLTTAKEKPFGFFEPAYVGLPLGVLSMLWMLIMYRWLPDNSKTFLRSVRDRSQDMVSAFELNPDSKYVGKRINTVLSFCGLQRQDLLKIRRRLPPGSPKVSSDVQQPFISNGSGSSAAATWRSTAWEFLTGSEVPERYTLVSSAAELGFDKHATESDCNSAGLIEILDASADEVAQAGDTFLFTMRQEAILDVVAFAKQHMLVSSAPAAKLICTKCDFLEVVIGVRSPLVHSPLRGGAELIEKLYGLGLIAVYLDVFVRVSALPDGASPEAEGATGAGRQVFEAGDRLLLLAPVGTEVPTTDFVASKIVGPLKPPVHFYDLVPLVLFIAGVCWASVVDAAMVVSVLMFVFMVLGGWVKAEDVRRVMDWDILILIGASLGLGTALSNSGLASALSVMVRAAGLGPQGALFLLTLVVVFLNEIVTSAAAATLGLPLAIALTKELKLKSVRPFAMAVLLGGSAAFACPIGYATHMMVFKPGNYTFMDFVKFGVVLDIIYIVGITLLVPVVFPFE